MKKSRRLGIVLIAAILALAATYCTRADSVGVLLGKKLDAAVAAVDSMTVAELTALMASKAEFKILDVRTQAEYDQGHIKGAKWAPRGKLEFIISGLAEQDETLILYCRISARAALAAQTLHDLGYQDIKYLSGGFMAWAEAGESIYNMHGELTVKNYEKGEADK